MADGYQSRNERQWDDRPPISTIVNRQSSIVNRQSSIVNRQSSIVNRQWRFAPTRDGEAAALRQRQSSVV